MAQGFWASSLDTHQLLANIPGCDLGGGEESESLPDLSFGALSFEDKSVAAALGLDEGAGVAAFPALNSPSSPWPATSATPRAIGMTCLFESNEGQILQWSHEAEVEHKMEVSALEI